MKSPKVVLSFETVDEIMRCGHIKYIKKLIIDNMILVAENRADSGKQKFAFYQNFH